jgi:hypothetical protein
MTLRDVLLLALMFASYLTASATEPRNVSEGRTGNITHMGAGYPADYLAIPIGPGHTVTLCGPAECLVLTSTDAGPSRASLEDGRIADVSVQLFERLCKCPASRGWFAGSWHVGGDRHVVPPATDTES